MEQLGFAQNEIDDTFQIVAMILHLGNVTFAGTGEEVSIQDRGPIENAAYFLGVKQKKKIKNVFPLCRVFFLILYWEEGGTSSPPPTNNFCIFCLHCGDSLRPLRLLSSPSKISKRIKKKKTSSSFIGTWIGSCPRIRTVRLVSQNSSWS